ncbi:hypothetical protein EMPS_11610 [Entomortierella parvispora]|uniref:Major facilitator superfamily (MFS) profile domain-containing protein n=1 Tax=Entomortierella parvispora TaxID=205924 RepID=A0A9P3HMM6_9FUNG|nr:hypothetical protein EMPS_11610 [Entomortierella parvispora]
MSRDSDSHRNDSSASSERTALLRNQESDRHPSGTHPPPTGLWPWRPHYWAAIPVIFLAGLSIGPAVAMNAPLVKELFCERGIPKFFPGNFSSDERAGYGHHSTPNGPEGDGRCNTAEYSAAIAKFVGINASLSAIAITLTVRFWAMLSDRIGRKRSMLLWASGMCLGQLVPLLVYYVKDMSVYMLWIGGLIEGFAGSILCVIALTHAYVADVTHHEQRIVVFGRVMAGYYAGLGLGSALGGLIVKRFGLIAAFWLMPAMFALDVVYISFIPESLTMAMLAHGGKKPKPATIVEVAIEDDRAIGNVSRPARTGDSRLERFKKSLLPEQLPGRLGGKHSVFLLLLTCFFVLLAILGATFQVSTYLLYRFQWTTMQLSNVGTIQGLSRLVALTVLLPFVKRFSPRTSTSDPATSISFDLKVVVIGLFIEALTYFLYGASTVGEGFYVGGVTGAVGSLFFPAIRGVLSQAVSSEMLGQTLGTLATFESLAAVLAPSLGAWFYGVTLKVHPSAVFYAASAMAMASTLLAASVLFSHTREVRSRH